VVYLVLLSNKVKLIDGDREGTDKSIQNVQDDGIPIIPQGLITHSRANKLRHSIMSYI
jgi:hypothetical protein